MDTSTAALDELIAPRTASQKNNSGSSRRIAKAIAWLAMLLLALYYVRHSVIPYLEVRPEIYDYLWPKRGWLWLHLSGGVLTLLLGWLQFVGRLRSAYPRFHRWTGRVYLIGLLVAAIGATAMVMTTPLGWTTAYAFAVMIGAWLITAMLGWLAIRKGDMATHRDWMRRNYIITFAFVTFRLAGKIPGLYSLGSLQEVFTTFGWMSWTVPLLLSEAFLALRRLQATPSLTATAQ
ncbi:MAG TPA: DUF2306 domain-containing protein [Pseudoxanthomonas sp.]